MIATAAVAEPGGNAPGSAPEPATNAASTADADAGDNDPSKVICRTVQPPTGTRLASSRSRQKICQTRAVWDQQARAAQEALKIRDSGLCPGGRGKCSG